MSESHTSGAELIASLSVNAVLFGITLAAAWRHDPYVLGAGAIATLVIFGVNALNWESWRMGKQP